MAVASTLIDLQVKRTLTTLATSISFVAEFRRGKHTKVCSKSRDQMLHLTSAGRLMSFDTAFAAIDDMTKQGVNVASRTESLSGRYQ